MNGIVLGMIVGAPISLLVAHLMERAATRWGRYLKGLPTGNRDRWGGERCDGYRQQDYMLCPAPDCALDPQPTCRLCGGYGELPNRPESKTPSPFFRPIV